MFIILLTIIMPAIRVEKKSNVKTVLIRSSIYNNGWSILAIITSFKVFIIFTTFYILSILLILSLLNRIDTYSSFNNRLLSLLVIRNIGGMPPLAIFWIKIIVLKNIVGINTPFLLIALFITAACIFIFHYFRSTLKEIFTLKKRIYKDKISSKGIILGILSISRAFTTII